MAAATVAPPPPAAVASRPAWRTAAAPVVGVLVGFPLWASLGLAQAIWAVAAVPMAVLLVTARGVKMPRGLGLWAAFVVWVGLSGLQLVERPTAMLGFSFRLLMYISAGVLLVYVFNLAPRTLATGDVLRLGVIPLTVLTVGGVLGFLFGEATIGGPLLRFLPGGVAEKAFLQDLFNPRFAQVQDWLGFDLPRPSFPYRFTNQWGSVMAGLIAVVIAGLPYHRRRHRPWVGLLLAVSIVPVVMSVNRGLWVSLAAMVVYVAVRHAAAGRPAAVLRLAAAVSVGLVLVFVSPLGALVEGRAESDHSNRARSRLYTLAVDQVGESPFVGFGAPREDEDNPNLPPVGSHGQVWEVLFSTGWVGAALFVSALTIIVFRTGRGLRAHEYWMHSVVVVLLVQLWFYNFFPGIMMLAFLMAGLLLRDRRPAFRAPDGVRP